MMMGTMDHPGTQTIVVVYDSIDTCISYSIKGVCKFICITRNSTKYRADIENTWTKNEPKPYVAQHW